jgi:hypothetical protein
MSGLPPKLPRHSLTGVSALGQNRTMPCNLPADRKTDSAS